MAHVRLKDGTTVEIFWLGAHDAMIAGWYWWPCLPGCLPDGEENGPFATRQEALDDASGG